MAFTFPPQEYAKTCEAYRQLVQEGKTVKAQRLAKTYRQKYLDPVFVMKPKEKRSIKFVSEYGFFTGKATSTDLGYLFWSDNKCHSQAPDFAIEFVRIPGKKLEVWQEMVSNYFQEDKAELSFVSKGNNRCDGKGKMFSEITISFDYYPDFKKKTVNGHPVLTIENSTISIVEDCFTENWGRWGNSLHFTNTSELDKLLVDYKLTKRLAVADSDDKSDTLEQTENIKPSDADE